MDEREHTPVTPEGAYAAVGEELLEGQGLPIAEVPRQAGAPVAEYPADDAIYCDPPEVSQTPEPIQNGPTGEYDSFGPMGLEQTATYMTMDGGVPPEEEEPAAKAVPQPVAEPKSLPTEDASLPFRETALPDETLHGPEKKKTGGSLWQTILRPIVVLGVICIVTSLLLGLTNELTAPIIATNTASAAEQARIALLPAADGFEAIEVPENLKTVTAIYRATNGVGWIVEAYGRGYGGQVPALVAFDENGDISGVTFAENSETVGLGQKVREPEFYGQFAGIPAQSLTLADVDKIASATISTNAAIGAINAAIEAYQQEAGEGGTGPRAATTEEVLALLLPGQTFSPITLSAQNVQPTAYVSNGGDYVIFGEQPGNRGNLVVAAVAINAQGEILNLWLDTSGEGDGYGKTLAINQSYISSFVGQTAPAAVDAVADITGSSNSVLGAVNSALDALPLAKEAA